MLKIETAFKIYGKKHIINLIKNYYGYVIEEKTIKGICEEFKLCWSDKLGEHFNSFRSSPDFWSYTK